jgi:hypothetical protein
MDHDHRLTAERRLAGALRIAVSLFALHQTCLFILTHVIH